MSAPTHIIKAFCQYVPASDDYILEETTSFRGVSDCSNELYSSLLNGSSYNIAENIENYNNLQNFISGQNPAYIIRTGRENAIIYTRVK